MRSAAAETHRMWVLVGSGVATLGYLAMAAFTAGAPEPSLVDAWDEVVTAVITFLGFCLAWRGHAGLASLIVIGVVWIEPHASIYTRGHVATASLLVFPGLTAASGLLLGRRVSWAMAVASVVSVVAVAALGKAAGNGPPGFDSGEIGTVMVSAFVLVGLAALLHVAVGAFHAALGEARESSARFERLVADAPDGIVAVGEGHTVLTANPKAVALLAGEDGDPVGSELGALVGSWEGRRVRAWLDAGAPGTVQLRVRDRIVEVTGRRVSPGVASGTTQLMLRDVTDRVAASQRAEEFSRVLRETPAEVVILDATDGTILFVSRGLRRNVGSSETELIEAPASTVIPGLANDGIRELRRRLDDSPTRTIRVPGLHRRADGSAYPTETEYAPAEFDGRSVLIGFVTDMSERIESQREQKKLQRQLEHAQKMEAVGHLAGGIAHDFNNLLTVVGGSADLLRSDVPTDLVDLVDEILNAQERGQVLIRRLLTFARKEIATPVVLDLGEVVAQTEVLIRRLGGEKIRVEFERGEELPPAMLDPGQVEQVVLNLVANARDAMQEGGTVRIGVTASSDRESVRLTVADDGPGIPPEVVDHLFEPFFTTKPAGEGTGLGLATVHGIVSEGGGTISVDSEVGRGATFTVVWPACEPAEAADAEEGPEAQLDAGSLEVLLVEDFPETRTLVARLLRRAGHRVHVAEDAETALALAPDVLRSVDVVVTDVVMPGISGIRMVEQLREMGIDAPALYVSGYLDEGVHGSIPGDERHGLLLKPFSATALNRRIGELVRAPADAGELVP